MHLKSRSESEVTEKTVRIIEAHVKLASNNVHLLFERLRFDERSKEHVAQNVDRLPDRCGWAVNPENRPFKGGVGINVTAHSVNLVADLLGRAAFRPIEKHVLQQMGQPTAEPLAFVNAAGLAPGLNAGNRRGMLFSDNDRQTI